MGVVVDHNRMIRSVSGECLAIRSRKTTLMPQSCGLVIFVMTMTALPLVHAREVKRMMLVTGVNVTLILIFFHLVNDIALYTCKWMYLHA